jgi:hypothetical protein
MRFALIATSVTAALVSPFIADAAGPQMSSAEFLSAVRCTAYEQAVAPRVDLGALKLHLNAEALRQPPQTAAQAQAEISQISRLAAGIENPAQAAMLHRERTNACASAAAMAGASDAQHAV